MSTKGHLQQNELFCAHNYSPLKVVIARAQGCWVTDVDGVSYLDFHSAYSGLNFGHNNPRFVAVAKDQLDKVTLTSRAFLSDNLGPFCESLAKFCDMEMVLPMNSGAEAVETAVKLARRWGYERKGVAENKAEIICFENNFHGRTVTIISFSDSADSRSNYGPYTTGFKVVPFGDINAVRAAITPNTVGILVEPIQGEAGILFPPDGFLKELRAISSKEDVLLIADEIQTGLCRTGKRFACDYESVKPDVYILAKSLGGGIVPISAVVSSRDILGIFTPGTHGSTFSGNPLACRIAIEVLRFIEDEKPEERSRELGEILVNKLRASKLKKVSDIRGRGLFVGVDIDPAFGPAKKICEELQARKVLCKDTRKQSIRLAPPLTISKSDLDFALEQVVAVLS